MRVPTFATTYSTFATTTYSLRGNVAHALVRAASRLFSTPLPSSTGGQS